MKIPSYEDHKFYHTNIYIVSQALKHVITYSLVNYIVIESGRVQMCYLKLFFNLFATFPAIYNMQSSIFRRDCRCWFQQYIAVRCGHLHLITRLRTYGLIL